MCHWQDCNNPGTVHSNITVLQITHSTCIMDTTVAQHVLEILVRDPVQHLLHTAPMCIGAAWHACTLARTHVCLMHRRVLKWCCNLQLPAPLLPFITPCLRAFCPARMCVSPG